jgi:uncharacterized protein
MEDYTVQELSLDDSVAFACHPGVPCFNECCRDLAQLLTPYDVLQLKNGLDLSSSEFLARYTHRYTGDETGLVVVGLKGDAAADQQCPFVAPEGCRVYPYRPGSCRSYPLARMAGRDRKTGQLTERWMLIKEPHCRGFEQSNSQTVRQWVKNQGLLEYNRMNDLMMAVISAKNRFEPGTPLDLARGNIFYTGCYDIDRFRDEIFEKDNWSADWFNADDLTAARNDDTALLAVSLAWTRKMLWPESE